MDALYQELYNDIITNPSNYSIEYFNDNFEKKNKYNIKKLLEYFSIYNYYNSRIKNISIKNKLYYVLKPKNKKYFHSFENNIQFLELQRFIKYEIDENKTIELNNPGKENNEKKSEEIKIEKKNEKMKPEEIKKPRKKRITKKDLYEKCKKLGFETNLKLTSLRVKELKECINNNTPLRQRKR